MAETKNENSDNLDAVLGEIDHLDPPKSDEISISASEIDIDDFKTDESAVPEPAPNAPEETIEPSSVEEEALAQAPIVPMVNIVEPDATVPETGTISVPHIDYEMPQETAIAGPDAFEQAISDLAEMKDEDLLANTPLRTGLDANYDFDLGLDTINLETEQPQPADTAYQTAIDDEMAAPQPQTISEDEVDSLIQEGLDFNNDEIMGLREESTAPATSQTSGLEFSEMTGIAAANEAREKPDNRKGFLIACCLVGIAIIVGAFGFGSSFFDAGEEDQTAAGDHTF